MHPGDNISRHFSLKNALAKNLQMIDGDYSSTENNLLKINLVKGL